MAVYQYQCVHCERVFDETFSMGTAPGFADCANCGSVGTRCFTAPHFTEDRTRFWRSANGTRFSQALGEDMPDSRKERDQLAKAKGIEFMGRSETPDHIKRAAEYGRHLKSGGDRIDNALAAEMMEAPKPPVKSVLQRLREGKRLGEIPTDRPLARRELPPFPKDVKFE